LEEKTVLNAHLILINVTLSSIHLFVIDRFKVEGNDKERNQDFQETNYYKAIWVRMLYYLRN